jgi:hypothetical protein
MGTEFMTKCRYVGDGPAWTLVAQEVSLAAGAEGALRSLSTASGDANMLFLQSPAASGNAAPSHFPFHSEARAQRPAATECTAANGTSTHA